MHMFNVLSIIVFFSPNFSFFDMFLFLKKFCSIKYVLLAFFILSCKSLFICRIAIIVCFRDMKEKRYRH